MRKIVIQPGGYHPFHAGHYALYKSAQNKFPDAEVYLAASNDTKTRPFPFEIKKKLAQLAGVSPNNFIQVKSPFRPQEITSKYDPENDILIFVRSEKDRNEEPKPGGTKKDGSPSYFQPYDETNLQPFGKHAYIEYLPTIEFGPGIKSATEIRNSWPGLNERQKLAMVMSLYPATQKNKKLADVAVKMLDAGIIGDQLNEDKEEDLSRSSINATSHENELIQYVRRKYPEAKSTEAAFIKFIIHSLEDSEDKDIKHDNELNQLKNKIRKLEQDFKNLRQADYTTNEATLVNDPEEGHVIVPDGGMGSYDISALQSKLERLFNNINSLVKDQNYENLYYILYKSGVLENALKAIVEYKKFMEKQGKRPIAKKQEIDISDYLNEK
jgi:hypothetical protein